MLHKTIEAAVRPACCYRLTPERNRSQAGFIVCVCYFFFHVKDTRAAEVVTINDANYKSFLADNKAWSVTRDV